MFIPSTGKYDTDIFLDMVSKRLEKIQCQDGTCGQSLLLNRNHLNAVQEINLACREVETPLQRLEHGLSSWVGYLVLPLFAIANAGVVITGIEPMALVSNPITLGITFGLLVEKPLGIFLFTFGIAKIGIIIGSFISAGAGFAVLRWTK